MKTFLILRKKNVDVVISYKALRQLIGYLGILLPLICILGGYIFTGLSTQRSISYYYYTNVRDIFVGILICISMFLLTYRGYELIDNIVNKISGITGLGIALFPCLYESTSVQPIGFFQLDPHISNALHFASAATFFILLSVNSMFLFTLTDKENPTKNKLLRNKIYIACGLIIIASIIILSLFMFFMGSKNFEATRVVIFFETIMMISFGASWLVKGEAIFKDREMLN